ncbi:MAG: hypothetical protein COS39_04855 [Hydrogenophilales bacterium CG03_land_8_20_14_0_80_62_28]|nr:hypothetical protein [Betaproteobacteria bacterium]OIO79290.1 MAG: hypothetical protein AUJ86_02485 [Hydrogenophilaceae bacterium CG1_02_62_390]PIV23273.1 MAG: hypothetical protein COS39_04855 [Hydrogenophilales bacterium CG03_land_8_20_14_0_80_62_28]PIW39009.1 MAG: hypothetical protein COW23_03495 [Hydrogenophilales bacterium CG15_BIG_FIL_POST_REV_8_21_14_020_62_31]PIW70787.1 MAG: hypothetical protein COW07_11385 [Hydrogenophilales bacterium CG12_big_fil_rev_8_21_14_0_65_61_21]PIX02499.1 M
MNKRLALLLLLWPGHALAEFSFDYDFDAHQKTWQELQAQLPAAPKVANLIPFEVGPAAPHRYFLDRSAISAGTDGVVRYTVVVRTAGGAENVSYEGMRCASAEQKIYAFGRPNGDWARNKYAGWQPIALRQASSYQRELFEYWFCTQDGPADMKAIQRAVASGGIRRD